MALARYDDTAVDEAGNVIPNATIEVRRDVAGRPVVPLFAGRNGTDPIGNPFQANADGTFGFHVTGGAYYIRAYTGPSQNPTMQRVRRYVAIGTAAEYDTEGLAVMLEAGTASFPTLAELEAFTPVEGVAGKVSTGDDAGYYHYDFGDEEWVFDHPLYDSLAKMTVTGGTANAIEASIDAGIADASVVAYMIKPTLTNTGPVTINGIDVLNVNGDPLAAGEFPAGRWITFTPDGADYAITSDPAIDAMLAQAIELVGDAEEFKDDAEAAAAAALAAVPNVFPATRTALKAVDTTVNTAAYLKEAGREGQFIWRSGDYTSLIAADTAEGVYIKADAIAASSGAWVRHIDDATPLSAFGVSPSSLDNNGAIQAAVDLRKPVGDRLYLTSGRYDSTAQIVIDNDNTVEPGPRSVTIEGEGAANTFLYANTASEYVLKLIGGTGVEAHSYEVHRDFSVMGGVPDSRGIWMLNKAYTSLENVTIQGHGYGMLLESVLSSVFRNVRIANNSAVGVETKKGAGFSNVNAIHWDSCKFQSNVALGYSGAAASTSLLFTNCNFENNGRQGQAGDSGVNLLFDGTEGAVGATFVGGYFESNAGDADLVLANSGSNYVTVVLSGVTFNRNDPARYPTNCIKTSGKIRLVLEGCGFQSYNSYVPDAARQYITGDADLILMGADTCHFADSVEATFALAHGVKTFAGRVSSAGVAVSLPRGWTCSKLAGSGNYRVTHTLGSTSYAVSPVTDSGAAAMVLNTTIGSNSFDVAIVNPSFSGLDASFAFTLTRA